MKKKLALCITAVLLVCLCAGGVTAMAAESELGASAACEGHTLGTFSGVPACVNENGDLHVCENNFPDEAFRWYISNSSYIFGAADGYITEMDNVNITTMRINILPEQFTDENGSWTATSLRGIEFFSNLKELYCSYGDNIKELNLSKNVLLMVLNLRSNKLTSLDLSNNVLLTELTVGSKPLVSLDLSKNTSLAILDIGSASIVNVDLSKNTELTELRLSGLAEMAKIDLSKNTKLEKLDLSEVALTDIDLSSNKALKILSIRSVPLTTLDLSNNTEIDSLSLNGIDKLTELDISNAVNLKKLVVDAPLRELDISGNSALASLNIQSTELMSLDISQNTELSNLTVIGDKFEGIEDSDKNYNIMTVLSVHSKALEVLDISNYTNLKELSITSNLISELDLSNNTALTSLNINDMPLTKVDLSKNAALTHVSITGTLLQELDISNKAELFMLFVDNNKLETLDVSNNPKLAVLWANDNFLIKLDVPKQVSVFKYENNKLAELDLSEVERIDPGPGQGGPKGFSYSPQNITVESSISGGKYVVDLSAVISPENLGKVANLSAGTYDSKTGIVTFDAMPESFTYYYDVGGEFDPMEVVVTVTNPKYEITQGADSTWTESSGDGLTITANGDFDSFTGVKVNGELLDRDNYTAVSGSTVITLKPEYLATLETGTYKLTVVYTDGEANTTFAVSAKEQPGTTDPENPGAAETEKPGTEKPANPDDVPQTGDSGMIIALTAIFVLTISGFAAVTVYRKKHN